MGSVCCCFHVPDVDTNLNGPDNGERFCFTYCFRKLMDRCGALFGREEAHPGPSSNQEAAHYAVAVSNSSATNSSHGVPLPTNSSSRSSQLQRNVVVERRDKGSGHSRVEPEPLIQGNIQIFSKLVSGGDKPAGSDCEGGLKQCHPESSVKVLSGKVESEVGYFFPSSEDEDVCPTCLEEYTSENPKIIAQCSHHYHLACIYEWMERSESCPVCGKVMIFDETT